MKIRTVLCPIDFTPLSDRAIALAVTLSRRFGARLVLEHNLDPRPPAFLSVTWMWSGDQASADTEKAHAAEDRLRVTLNGLPQDVAHEARLTRGPMDLGLAELARTLPADLLVMGSHGWSSAAHSSLTERLLEIAPCPVLALGSEDAPAAFLAETGHRRVFRYPIGPDGRVRQREEWARLEPRGSGPDGMAFDRDGRLYVAHYGAGTVDVFDRQGRLAETIPVPGKQVTNVAFGGPDGRTLVVTDCETGTVYRARSAVPGLPLFGGQRWDV